MRALGDGSELWRAEVVLWTSRGAEQHEPDLIDAVRAMTGPLDAGDAAHPPEVGSARSYDMQPPAPDSSVGVSFWVHADTVGQAAESAFVAVIEAADQVLHDLPFLLWDLRVIPRAAILSGPGAGTPLTREA